MDRLAQLAAYLGVEESSGSHKRLARSDAWGNKLVFVALDEL